MPLLCRAPPQGSPLLLGPSSFIPAPVCPHLLLPTPPLHPLPTFQFFPLRVLQYTVADTSEISHLLLNAFPHFIHKAPVHSSKPHLSATLTEKPSGTSWSVCWSDLDCVLVFHSAEHLCSGFPGGNPFSCHDPWGIWSPERGPQSVQRRGQDHHTALGVGSLHCPGLISLGLVRLLSGAASRACSVSFAHMS